MTPLVSADELLPSIDDPALRLADVRWYLGEPDRAVVEYQEGHIPGAVFVDLDSDLSAPPGEGRHPLPSPEVFCRYLAAKGFGSDHRIVAYDSVGGAVAARLWWMLDDLGHRNVIVLDGGLPAWLAAGGELTTIVPHPPPARLDLAGRWSRVIDRGDLRRRLGEVLLLDARSPERYRGDTEPVDLVAGHIPTAVNRPVSTNLDGGGRFRDSGDLAVELEADRPVVVSCGSGVNACHTALAMRVAGLEPPLLYAGSYSDWTRAGLPVVVGDQPGAP